MTTIEENKTYILMEDGKPKQMIKIEDGQTYQNRSGAFHHQSLINQKLGEKLWSKSKMGFIHLLTPNPCLITDTVEHKTQILFQMDISLILLKLNVKPGSLIVESGTGSGSLSSSFAQTIGEQGKLFTYEFNEMRAKNGQEVLNRLGYKQGIVFHRDVYTDGFQEKQDDFEFNKGKEYPKEVNGVFLDLPKPWLALKHLNSIMQHDGRICCFSPCIEQVQKTVEELKNEGWKGIETIECLKRNFERRVKTESQFFEGEKKVCTEEKKKQIYYSAGQQRAYGHTGYLTFGFKP